MGTSREKFQRASKPLIDTYNEMQLGMFRNIAKNVGKNRTLYLRDIEGWAERRLSDLGALRNANEETVRMLSGKGADAMRDGLWNASSEQLRESDGMIAQLKKAGADLPDVVSLEESEQIMAILNSYQKSAVDTLNLTNASLLDNSERVYREIVNRTVADVMTGVRDKDSALRSIVRQWSRRGIPALTDKAGRTWGAESYVRTLIRTTSNKVTQEMQEQRYDEHGIRLIEVSSHQGAREKCEPYQGRIFARGDHGRYPNFYTETSYGEPDGILGINCHHVTYPFVQGYSKKRFKGYDKDRNRASYENSQTQRKLETEVRHAKTELAMVEELGNDEMIKEAKTLVREKQKRVRTFVKGTGRTRRYNREQIYG